MKATNNTAMTANERQLAIFAIQCKYLSDDKLNQIKDNCMTMQVELTMQAAKHTTDENPALQWDAQKREEAHLVMDILDIIDAQLEVNATK